MVQLLAQGGDGLGCALTASEAWPPGCTAGRQAACLLAHSQRLREWRGPRTS